MRIGVDATCWWSKRGFGRFTRELLKAMISEPRGHEFVFFVDQQPVSEMLVPYVDVIEVKQTRPVTKAAVASSSRSVKDLLAFRHAVSQQSLDLFFFPAVYSWYPIPRNLPMVLTLSQTHFP